MINRYKEEKKCFRDHDQSEQSIVINCLGHSRMACKVSEQTKNMK